MILPQAKLIEGLVVKLLLEKGADVSVANMNRITPLNGASDRGHFEVVKLLLEKGADMTFPDNDGWTPLKSASSNGHVEVVELKRHKQDALPNRLLCSGYYNSMGSLSD
jgi:ankyrin repeat protein